MKKIFGLCLLFFVLSGCMKNEVVVPEYVFDILKAHNIQKSTITKLGQYEACVLENENINISEQEVNEYINTLLESFTEIVEVCDRNIVEPNDVVYISYGVFYSDELINLAESEVLVVGANHYNEELENALIGKIVGEPFSVRIVTTEGKELDYDITIESINYFKTYELTEMFVQEKMELQTMDEFYKFCYDNVYANKKSIQQAEIEKKLFNDILELCEYSLDAEEIAFYSKYLIHEEEQLAYVYNLDLETYVEKVLGKELDNFYQETYEHGEYEIKKYLTIGAIFHDLTLTISDKEFENMCIKMELDYDKVQSDKYTNAMVNYSIMQNKVLDFFNKKGDD